MVTGMSTAYRALAVTAATGLTLGLLRCASDDGGPDTIPGPDRTTQSDEWSDAAEWALETFGDFEPVSESGQGNTVIDLPADVTAAKGGIIRVEYSGTTSLTLESINAEGELSTLLLDTSTAYNTADPGSFEGETNWWGANEPPSQINVSGDGTWALDIAPVHRLPQLPERGRGVRSYLYDGPGGQLEGRKTDLDVGMGITEITPCNIPCDWGGSLKNVTSGSTAPDYTGTLSLAPSWILVTHRGEWTMALP